LWHLDQPFAAPNLYLHWGMYGAARDAGANVFLDGLDGDTVVSHGLGRLNALLQAGSWDAFEREVRSFAANAGKDVSRVLSHFGLPYLSDLAAKQRWIAWVRAAREMSGRFAMSRGDIALKHGLLPAVPRRATRLASAMLRRKTPVLRPPVGKRAASRGRTFSEPRATLEHEAHLQGLMQPAYQQTLEIADGCAAAFGIEPRYPFFDRRLIEFCLQLPDEQKFADGWSRLVLRRAMEGVLPAEVQWRTDKANLSPAFHHGLRSSDRSRIEGISTAALRPYVNAGDFERVRDQYLADPDRQWGDPDSFLLFRSAVLSAWLLVEQRPRPAQRVPMQAA
jgi:asparagine synthase (glutamine-hydrolysing)